jgi:hypothetical protein
MLHPSATLGWEMLETLYPATAAIRRMLFDAHNQAAVADLATQHPHHGSLENVVTMGQPPDTSTRGPYYGTQNIFFHIEAPATSWILSVCNTG